MTLKTMEWQKINHFTNEPYKKNPKDGGWYVVDYISGDYRISNMSDHWLVTKCGESLGKFKTLKAAKTFAEAI